MRKSKWILFSFIGLLVLFLSSGTLYAINKPENNSNKPENNSDLGELGISITYGFGRIKEADKIVKAIQIKYNFLHHFIYDQYPYQGYVKGEDKYGNKRNWLRKHVFCPNGISAISPWIGYGFDSFATPSGEQGHPYMAGLSLGLGRSSPKTANYHLPAVHFDFGFVFYDGVDFSDNADWYVGASVDFGILTAIIKSFKKF